jgi:hypothetical protein
MSECHEWLFTFSGMVGAWIGIWVHNRLWKRRAERPQGKTLFPKERIMPETAPNAAQSKEDGSESP